MKSAYELITQYEGDNFEEMLRRHDLHRLFFPVLDRFKTTGHAETIIKYLCHCYSTQSEFVLRGATWAQIKVNVAKYVELPEHFYDRVVELGINSSWDTPHGEKEQVQEANAKKHRWDLELEAVTEVIHDYMTYENDRDNRHLKMLYDLYEEQMAGTRIASSYEEKDKCRKRANETKKEMEEIEQGMANKQNSKIKEGLRELAKAPTALRPEIAARK